MEWLRNNSFISVNRQSRNILNTNEECDPGACYDSFKEHWLQTYKIIQRSQQLPSQDDVLSVVNHLEQMVTLLVYDVKKADMVANLNISDSKCLNYLLDSRILEQLFEWGIRTGKYANAVCLEQLKFYEMLVCHVRQLLLAHETFLRPMLRLLNSCQSNVFPKDVEKCLVSLLSQICVLLTQNSDMLELFFTTEQGRPKFIIFDLLVTFLHREDYSGMQARDALLLCMSLTKKNDQIASYISEQVNICVLLATGLSGLYTILPNVLSDIVSPDWHRLTPDDVKDIKNLCTFITSLEFSNAVAQVSHPSIQKQMQEFLHRGFLIPVLGPALLQTDPAEQIAATAYLELILRTVTSPGLLYSLLQFLLQVPYDGQKMLDILIKRINSENQISLVTISLFETIVDLNCEDLMLELVFQHLLPSLHLILSHRQKMLLLDPHCHSFEKFLALAPNCINIEQLPRIDEKPIFWNYFGGHQTLYGNYHAYLCDARSKITSCQIGCSNWSNSYNGYEVPLSETNFSEDNVNSLPSLGESSGYESLKAKLDENIDETSCDLPIWQISQSNLNNQIKQQSMSVTLTNDNENLNSTCGAGPFLTAVLEKLKCFLSNSLYINLHLTGLISRLAVYSQPLLRSYLLDHSLVLQPNIPSLFQIIGILKLQIDEFMGLQPDSTSLIRQAKEFLLERETRLINARRNAVERNISSSPSIEIEEPFRRNGSKRRSFTSSFSSISNMFARRPSQIDSNIPLITTGESSVSYHIAKFTHAQHVALCAVLLDEWVKELAALAQEHTIAQLAALLK
ncbi:UPF0518 protein AGAP011705-like [Agrilus planipennis]|uniref:UPF0518 protein AGAP011705-like n=1 Tax=Agrilus planipennis TaxID=224129 RepID=A0A7F5RCK3_AGRPL|nr:UPF0518 protein AGAP011705-like [Agrilus planipennis]